MFSTIILLIAFGIVLLGIEFVLPGAVLGILGIAALAGASVLAFVEYGAGPGFATAIGAILLVIAFVFFWVKYFHRTYLGRKLSLDAEVGGKEIYETQKSLLGRTGIAASDLHPSGKALIDGRKIDVVAEVGLISKDEPVVVVQAEGMRIVVQRLEEEPAKAEKNA